MIKLKVGTIIRNKYRIGMIDVNTFDILPSIPKFTLGIVTNIGYILHEDNTDHVIIAVQFTYYKGIAVFTKTGENKINQLEVVDNGE